MIAAYPLQWPTGWPRTSAFQRKNAAFGKSERQYSADRQRSWTRLRDLTVFDGVLASPSAPKGPQQTTGG